MLVKDLLTTSVLENGILIVIDPVLGGTGSKMVVPFEMDYAYPEGYSYRV